MDETLKVDSRNKHIDYAESFELSMIYCKLRAFYKT